MAARFGNLSDSVVWLLPGPLVGAVLLFVGSVLSAAELEGEGREKRVQELIEDRQFSRALQVLDQGSGSDENLGSSAYLRGKLLNRIGEGPLALANLTLAARLGCHPADFDFEAGWALLQSGQPGRALEYLKYYHGRHPGHAKTLALMAEAELKLGRKEEAREHVRQALRKDPALKKGSAGLTEMALTEGRGDASLETGQLLEIAVADPSTRYAVLDRLSRIYATSGLTSGKPWSLELTLGGGYNSNVVGLADGLLLPGNISNKGTGFARAMINASSRWYFGAKDLVTVGGIFQADVYEGAGAADLIDQFWYSTWQHRFAADWISTLRVSDEFTMVGGEAYRNQTALRPALVKYWLPGLATELSTPVSYSDYYFQTFPVQDRDSVAYGTGLNVYWQIPKTSFQLRGGICSTSMTPKAPTLILNRRSEPSAWKGLYPGRWGCPSVTRSLLTTTAIPTASLFSPPKGPIPCSRFSRG